MQPINPSIPEDRLNVYERLFQRYASSNPDSGLVGICGQLPNDEGDIRKINLYPELIEQKPENTEIDDYWFPIGVKGKSIRLEVIRKAISKVKTIINAK